MSMSTSYFVSFNIIKHNRGGNIVIRDTGYGIITSDKDLESIINSLPDNIIELIKKRKNIDIEAKNIHVITFNRI